MKKLIASLLILMFIISTFVSCSFFTPEDKPDNTDSQVKLRVGYMAGPTGMGMAKLISDNGGLENGNEKYSFTKYADTNAAKTDLAAGKIDIICLPTNEAAVYAAKVDRNAKVLAINCLNSLYLITNGGSTIDSLDDLAGQTLYTCKNGTPRVVLEHIIKEAGINATVSYEINEKEILTPADLSAQVIAGNIPNAVMPEPLVTSTLMKINSNTSDEQLRWAAKVNLADEWEKISDTPITMGCVVASGNIISSAKSSVDAFLEEYKASVEFVGNSANLDSAANYVVETGVMGAAPAAKMALTNLGSAISYIDGAEMKNALVAFYTSIGVALPSDEFYYEK